MKSFVLSVVGIVGLALLSSGCGEDSYTVNQPTPPAGAIYGYVASPQSATTVAVHQATLIASTTIQTDGYFQIHGLRTGLYKVVILAPDGATRLIVDLDVATEHHH